MELVPGTCAERYLAFKNTQGSQITFEDIEAEKVRLGLDKPFFYRYGKWVSDIVLNQDFGDSCILRMNINDLLSGRFVLSLNYMFSSFNIFIFNSDTSWYYFRHDKICFFRSTLLNLLVILE